jgi:uncharacterized protein (DUF362 family)
MAKAIVLVHGGKDRTEAARSLLKASNLNDLHGSKVLVKPNFNTADESPGSTHLDTLIATLDTLKEIGASHVVVGDRSGPAETRKVFEDKGIFTLAKKMVFEPLIFDEMPRDRFVKISPTGSHWRNGFLFVKNASEVDGVIGLGCLKTHMYGGHFTLSLKLATGMVHRQNMKELHSSMHMREMIADINTAYNPRLMILDGVEAFYEGGPMVGSRWNADLSFASTDRVALDAVGVAALKMHGTTSEIESRGIFQQDQIKRAVQLGLGVGRAEDIELHGLNDAAERSVEKLGHVLYSDR